LTDYFSDTTELSHFKDALKNPVSDAREKWRQAIKLEFKSMKGKKIICRDL